MWLRDGVLGSAIERPKPDSNASIFFSHTHTTQAGAASRVHFSSHSLRRHRLAVESYAKAFCPVVGLTVINAGHCHRINALSVPHSAHQSFPPGPPNSGRMLEERQPAVTAAFGATAGALFSPLEEWSPMGTLWRRDEGRNPRAGRKRESERERESRERQPQGHNTPASS